MRSERIFLIAYTLMCLSGGIAIAMLLFQITSLSLLDIYMLGLYIGLPSTGVALGMEIMFKEHQRERAKKSIKPLR